MNQILEQMLLEASFKDVLSTMVIGDILLIKQDNDIIRVSVESNMTGRLIVKDESPQSDKSRYIITKDALNGNKLTVFKYDSDASTNDFKGKKIVIGVTDIRKYDGKTSQSTDVDMNGDNNQNNGDNNQNNGDNNQNNGDNNQHNDTNNIKKLQQQVDYYNNLIEKLDDGDVLIVSTESPSDDENDNDSVINNFFFKIIDIKKNFYVMVLDDVDVAGDEPISTSKIISNFEGKKLYIKKGNFFKLIDNEITLEIIYNKSLSLPIKNIIDVEIDEKDDEIEEPQLTKDEMIAILQQNPNYREMINKTRGFWDVVSGASPKGIYQLKKMMDKRLVNNSYLTKGNVVKFRLLSGDIKYDLKHKILNRKGITYSGKIEGENLIKIGTRGKGHWEIQIVEETDDFTFDAIFNYCKSDRTCHKVGTGVIKIIENNK